MTGDCQFTLISEGSNNLALSNGNFPSSNNPTQPLSDVTAVRSLTTPNNEPCNFPYTYTPENWQMYFCRAYSNSNFTCLTASGLGQCSTVLLFMLTYCYSQNINYQCNFDSDMTGDCQFTLTSEGSNNLALSNGNFPSSTNPTQPLSDVTAVRSLTTPNNEPCNFPYTYTPGNWQMYFCQRHSNSNFTCPTASGLGQCSIGKFAAIAASGTDAYDQTYVTDVKQSSSAIQCLDFYYYISGTSSNARMHVGWKADTDTQQIIELTAHSKNGWQNSLNNFTAPSSSSYQLTFRMMRDAVSFNHVFAFDEIKIYDQPCGSNNLALSNGNFPSSNNPTQPLSDVTAVRSLTTPNNEPCNFPYPYTPGNWQSYFCRAYSNSNFTCPTNSGLGQCSIGKFAAIAASGIGAYDQTYVTDVKQSSSAIQCLDFYYYIPGTSSNARMQVGLKADADTQQIIELTAHSENRWQNSRRNFTAPSSSSYQLTFRMMRDAVSFNHLFGLDEIKIYDQPCSPSSSSYQLTFRMMRDTGGFSFTFGLDEIKIYDQPCDSSMTTTNTESATTKSIKIIVELSDITTITTLSEITTTESITTATESIITESITTATESTITESITTATESIITESIATTISSPEMITSTSTIDASTLSETTAAELTTMTSITTTVSTTPSLFESSVITQDVEETLSSNVPIITTTTSTYTTIEPLLQIFNCDFSTTLCFESGELVVTNGNKFTSVDIVNEPPRFPLSDVSSIIEPTDNNELCKLPYQPSIDNSTNITSSYVWFCYKNQCPTESQELANCKSGNYGLISVKPWESSKTIVESINEEMMIRSSVGHRCLRYYYYFTVYDKLDWGQQISVLIKFDNEINNEIEIDRLSAVDMIENRWHSRNIAFNSIFANYILMFRFEVTNVNRPDDPASNKTIYFALDNIELDNGNCQSVIDPSTGQTTISQSPTTTITTTSNEVTATSPPPSNNLSLILGLSLGLGIPLLLFIIGSVFFAVKGSKRGRINPDKENQSSIHMKSIK
ncbi:unnamed protein product [Rotaria sordida]|uniref:MAM domain-containing protein n=3 Tax=Rotaria sordida TaxID=392033 RepID=A0A814B834_9BILA|nr:unnamed protein product [Rotaria sordida]